LIWASRARLYRLLDRPGGRSTLARLATAAARRETRDDVGLVYRGAWLARLGDEYIPVADKFTYRHGPDIRASYDDQFEIARDIWFHNYTPREGDVVVDVGAGIGSETFVFSKAVGDTGRVLAIEAHPKTFRILEAQCRANRLANVVTCSCAVTDAPRPVFIEDRKLHERNTISASWQPGRRREPVDGQPLDDICARYGIEHIDFLKMNIEGAEVQALAGMTRVIERTQHVCIACHDFLADTDPALRTRERVVDFLEEHGFTVTTRENDSRTFVRDHVHASRGARSAGG
jgi:FkbM family methyltransferase